MNANQLAKALCDHEGLKINLSIAQIKEVLRVERELFAEQDFRLGLINYLYRMEQKVRVAAKALKPKRARGRK